MFQCLPSLIILGAQRASSRELYDWLSHNPQAVGYGSPSSPQSAETHYFDSLAESQPFHGLQPLRRKGQTVLTSLQSSWRSTYLAESPRLTIERVVGRTPVVVFEKTPAYLDEADPATIHALLPSVKLVVSLREPAARLWSAYWRRCQQLTRGCSTDHFVNTHLVPAEQCVEQALELDSAACLALFPSGFQLRAVLHGMYDVYLSRYQRAFSVGKQQQHQQQLLVVFAESFVLRPFHVMREIEHFANLPEFDYKSRSRYDYAAHMHVLSQNSKALQRKPRGYVPFSALPQSTRERMMALYKDSNNRLRRLLLEKENRSFIKLSAHRAAWFRGER